MATVASISMNWPVYDDEIKAINSIQKTQKIINIAFVIPTPARIAKSIPTSGYAFKGDTPHKATYKNSNNINAYTQTGVPVVKSDSTFTLSGDNIVA